MEYQDASHTGSTVHSEPVARPDVDTLPAGSYGPATGNAITGAGTSTGASGADTAAAGATIVEVQGAGGASNHADGNFQANGQYGVLSMDAQGDFSYVRNPGTPDGVKDVFHYTLANAAGANSSTTLTIDIGEVAAAAAGQGVVMLPAGVEMSDIHVNGRDLVIDMPNGTQMVIPNGAVFVPQLTIGDVQVPPTNLAALLIDSEPQPAAGPPQSSGGNFAEPVPPLDPGVPLGDLIPPTELSYTPPEFRPVGQFENTKPTVVIETPDNPAGVVDASESVKEAGLPTRNGGEPAGSGEIADGNPSNNSDGSETNTGTIVFTAQDGLGSITVGGTAVTAVGQQIQGQYGVMTITGIDIAHGQITYSYTLSDNTSGDSTQDVFSVVVTDRDGDTATGSLTVHIVDDVPTARNDTDTTDNSTHVAAGNVMTGAGTTSGASGADTVGADNAHLTAVSGAGGSDSTADSSGNFQVAGHYGMLTINADGTYTYTLNENAPGGSVDTFTYTLTDGDGDTSTATLTISNPNHVPTLSVPTEGQAGTVVDEKGLPPHGDGLPAGSGEIADQNPNNNSDQSETTTGTITFTPGDAPAVVTIDGVAVTGTVGQTFTGDHGTLTITGYNANGSIQYSYTLTDSTSGDHTTDSFSVVVTDSDGDHANGTLTIDIVDDVPTAHADINTVSEGGTVTGNVESNDVSGADGFASGGGVTGVESGSHTGDVVTTGVGTPVTGLYGTLTLQADGSYSYHANPNTNPPSGATDVFTYTITDGDGDTSTTTLTINVNDVTLVADNQDKTVYESALDLNKDGADLAAGTVTGSNPSSTGETVQGQLNVSGATGYTVQDVTTANGVFHLNANGSYTYTLTTPVDEATADNGPDTQNNVESFTYTAHDANGNTVTGTITIDVVDDVPTARSDADSVTEDGATVADGNAITGVGGSDANSTDGVADTPGADGATITGIKLPASGSYTAVSTSSSGTQIVGTYGTLTIHSDGSYSYQLNNSATNVQALHVGQQVTDTFNYQLTDGDGDTSLANIVITVNGSNDAPVVGSATVSVSEEGLMGANPDSTGSPDTTNSVTASGTISMTDVDSGDAHTWTLTAPANGSVKSDGYNVIWTGSGTGTLHAYQDVNGNGQVDSGEKAIATITIDNTGHYTVTLQGPIDHPTANVEDATSFGVTVNVNDGTTTSTGTLTVSVEDDSPVNFTPVSLTDTTGATATTLDNAIVNDGTAVVTAFLNDTNSDPSNGEKFIGADGFGSLAFTTGTHTNGEVLKDANGTTLTSGGQTIYVFGYGTDTLTATTDANYATDHNAASVVFTVHLTEGAGYGENSTYTIDFNQTLDDGSGITLSNFSAAPAGQNQWIGLDSDGNAINVDNNDSPDLLLTPTNAGGTINTSSTDIGNGNQWISGGEGIRIDYVTDVRYGSGNETNAGGYTFDGHYDVTGTSFKIMQEQGSGSGSAIRIAAYNDPDTGTLTTLSGSLVQIDPSSIVVTGDTTYNIVNMGDGTFVITGLAAGAVVSFDTGGLSYDAISITNAAGSSNPNGGTFSGQDFAIGQFGYFTAAAGHDIPLSFGVTATDADGDTSTGTIDLTVVPDGSTSSAAVHTASVSSTSLTTNSIETSSLIATNDNGHQDHRSFSAGNNAALMGALAAAGLTGMEHVHANQAVEHSHGHGPEMMPLHSAPVFSPVAHAGGGDVEATHVIASDTLVASDAHPQHGSPLHATPEATHGLAGENAGHAAQLAELLHGSEGAAHASPHATAAMTAATVIMPSAQQLAAMTPDSAVQPQASVAGEAQHNQVVGKVLADALHGGGDHGHHDVDSLVHALHSPHHGNGGDPTMEALATHGHAAVSIGHMAFAGAFGGGHMMSSMDSVAHPDAAPVHG